MSALQPDEKVCPYCAEVIKAAAVKCRYCQSDLGDATAAAEPIESDAPTNGHKALEDDHGDVSGNPDDPDDPPPPPASTEWSRDDGARQVPFLGSFRLLIALVVVCLVLCCVGGVAWWRSEHPEHGVAPDGAITSTEARDAGMQAAARLTQKVFSFDWKTLDADTKAAQALLAPSFRNEYSKTMAKVKKDAIKNQLKLTTSADATSIVSATENKVVALVFLTGVTTAKGAGNQRVDSSRMLVTLTRSGGGDWRISKLKDP